MSLANGSHGSRSTTQYKWLWSYTCTLIIYIWAERLHQYNFEVQFWLVTWLLLSQVLRTCFKKKKKKDLLDSDLSCILEVNLSSLVNPKASRDEPVL